MEGYRGIEEVGGVDRDVDAMVDQKSSPCFKDHQDFNNAGMHLRKYLRKLEIS